MQLEFGESAASNQVRLLYMTLRYTARCNEIRSLTSLDARNSPGALSEVKESISLHQAVHCNLK